jgi:arylsulfatase A-like enzyme
VPLIVLGPTELVGKPAKLAGLVELIDLFPTVTDLAGVRSPSGIDGASVAQYLRSSSKIAVGSSAVSETRWRKGVNKIAVTDGESLLVENRDGWPGTAPEELYGFAAPQNGAADSTLGSNPQVASRLREELARFEGAGRF